MSVEKLFDLHSLHYMRCSQLPPGVGTLPPSAWTVARHGSTFYWLDLSLWWGDGISRLYTRRRYPNTITVAPNFGPLRQWAKLSLSRRQSYWHHHGAKKRHWIQTSKERSQHLGDVAARWYERLFGPRFAYDVMLQSETKIHSFRTSILHTLRYVREGIVVVEKFNDVQSTWFGDTREIVAFARIDPARQTTLDRWYQRVWFVDHDLRSAEIHLDGIDPPARGRGKLVDTQSIYQGVPSMPWTGHVEPINPVTYSQFCAHRGEFLKGYRNGNK
jgi:hypothetical protein